MLAIKPYTGFYLRVNEMAKDKDKTELSVPSGLIDDMVSMGASDEDIADWMEYMGASDESVNLFDEKEVEEAYQSKDAKWNRCQFGWQIGATLDIKQFNVGIGYALDFNEISKKVKTSKFAVTVGYNF